MRRRPSHEVPLARAPDRLDVQAKTPGTPPLARLDQLPESPKRWPFRTCKPARPSVGGNGATAGHHPAQGQLLPSTQAAVQPWNRSACMPVARTVRMPGPGRPQPSHQPVPGRRPSCAPACEHAVPAAHHKPEPARSQRARRSVPGQTRAWDRAVATLSQARRQPRTDLPPHAHSQAPRHPAGPGEVVDDVGRPLGTALQYLPSHPLAPLPAHDRLPARRPGRPARAPRRACATLLVVARPVLVRLPPVRHGTQLCRDWARSRAKSTRRCQRWACSSVPPVSAPTHEEALRR
jgi:hypothetical protein